MPSATIRSTFPHESADGISDETFTMNPSEERGKTETASGGRTSAPGRSRRPGNRRVVAPGTSGQPEEVESQQWVPQETQESLLGDQQQEETPHQTADRRAEWLKQERPPHWG